jgi:acetoacetyl-[acyl-carrier protein] synthase
MSRLPVIVGLGGVNPAGRISSHHAYRRMVIDVLSRDDVDQTYRALAGLMKLEGNPDDQTVRDHINAHTLIRRIESYDPRNIPWQRQAQLNATEGETLSFEMSRQQLPLHLPENWQVKETEDGRCIVSVQGGLHVMLPDRHASRVGAAGQLPTGFEPEKLYQSRNHPRGLQLAVYGASDAVRSMGIDWSVIKDQVRPDQIGVYSGSAMGQLGAYGNGGMLQSRLMGKRVTSKQLALGLCDMPGNFINAYVLGSVGATGAVVGACATFLYNLLNGINDIRSGKRRVVLVGNSEAPVTPEIIDGYRTMGALAEDEALMALDGLTGQPEYRRACRPFGENCGFTVSEASVYTVLMDDELAVEMGANILGAVGEVYVNSDGFKKSIPGPGVGNYVTVAKAMAMARTLLGEEEARRRSYVMAHGTGTPQNRVTESHILNEVAKAFGIDKWTVAAIKGYLGHPLAPASGDQLASVLGTWRYGWIPGINTIDKIADDVHSSHLSFSTRHLHIDPESMDAALINSKGFGGNNATGLILSPFVARAMIEKKHGAQAYSNYLQRNEAVAQQSQDYDEQMSAGQVAPIYEFGQNVVDGADLSISDSEIRIPGFGKTVDLNLDHPYPEMTDKAED